MFPIGTTDLVRQEASIVAVKASIAHHRVALPQRTYLEATAIEIHGALGGVLFVKAYKPSQKELLTADLEAVFDAHRRVFVVGDLNCKHPDWNSLLTAPNGKRFRRFAESRRIRAIGPGQPTFYSAQRHARSDVLDIEVIQGIACPVEISCLTELSSENLPVSVEVATQHSLAIGAQLIIECDRYGQALCRRLPEAVPLGDSNQIDAAVAVFDEAVTSAVEVFSRMKARFTLDYQRITDEIASQTRDRNRLRRR